MRSGDTTATGFRKFAAAGLVASAIIFFSPFAAYAQQVPTVINPPEVTSDPNGLNLLTGKVTAAMPAVSIPAAPRLSYTRASDFMFYVDGQRNVSSKNGYFTVNYGGARSENFECQDAVCLPGNSHSNFGAVITGPSSFTQEKTREQYTFNVEGYNYDSGGVNFTEYFASKVTYPDGEVLSLTYELIGSSPRVTKVQSSTGYYLELQYVDSGSNWTKVKTAAIYANASPTVALAKHEYSVDGTQVTDLGGRTWQCTPDCYNAGFATPWVTSGSTKLPSEGTAAVSYSANLLNTFLTKTVIQDGVDWNYTYNGVAKQTVSGALKSYKYDSISVAGPNSYSRTYDVQVWDKGTGTGSNPRYVIQYVKNSKDELNRLTSFNYGSFAVSGQQLTGINYPEGNSVQFDYDLDGNVIKQTNKAKVGSGLSDVIQEASYALWRPVWFRDGKGNQTDYVYNASTGLLERQLDPADASGIRKRTEIEYEAHPASYGVGTLHRKTKVRECGVLATDTTTCVTDEPYTTFAYLGDTYLPTVVSIVSTADNETRTTVTSYDAAGRVLSIDGPLAGTDDTQYFRYDTLGRKIWEIGPLPPNGLRVAKFFTYRDADDKVTRVQTGTVTDVNNPVLTEFDRVDMTYDSRRNAIREVRTAGTQQTVADRSYLDRGLAQCTTVRMNIAALPAATATGACIAGTAGADGRDRIVKNIYDNAGQLVQVREGVGGSNEAAEATYSYTNNGKRRYVIDANGNRAELVYDGHDRLQKWVFPSTTRAASYNDSTQSTALSTAGSTNTADYEQYGYDANGNRTSLRKRDGSTLTYSFDNLNRMIVKVVPSRANLTAAQTRDVYYDYDSKGLMVKARFDSLSGEGITSSYNGFGELMSSRIAVGSFDKTLTYSYDLAGRRLSVTHPDGLAFTYTRDKLGRVTNIYEGTTQNGTTQLVQAGYDNRGLVSSVQRAQAGLAFLTTFGYDGIGRLTSLANDAAGTADDLTITQSFNPASQIASQTRSNDSYSWTGSVAVNRNYTTNGLNQYTAAGSATFTYDANGNLTSDGSSTFVYDIENRLVSASGAKTAGLTWDPMGRLWKVTGSTTDTRFLYDGDELVAEYDAAGTMARRYVHSDNADDPVVQYDSAAIGAANRTYLMGDERGSIVGMIYDNGTSRAINSYDEYGIPGASNQGRFQYTGQAWLPELGMYHYKARIYSPTLGRFLQVDPIGYDDQVNLYAYVGNDPVNKVDPTGLEQDGEGFANAAEYLNYRARMAGAHTPSQRESVSRSYRENFDAKGLGHLANEANHNSQESTRGLQRLYSGDRPPSAGELAKFAKEQGWTASKAKDGPLKFTDENGTVRLTIKAGSARTPGSEGPHISYRDVDGNRRDPVTGERVTRRSEGNHRPVEDQDETRRRRRGH